MSPEDIAASALANLNRDKKSPAAGKKKTARRSNKKTIQYPVEPTVIQSVSKGRGYMNHSYRDFSKVPPTVDYVPATKIEDMGFAEKIHHILGQEEYAKHLSWMPHGRAFKVAVPVVFERLVCPKYFGHKRYSSFLRQLNNHGFKHISTGTDRNCYYHECMLKDMPHLCKYMPAPKDARRQIPDPENEPDFYKIAAAYPLPGQEDTKVSSAPPTISAPPASLPASKEISLLQSRVASEIPWMQMPPAKRVAVAAQQSPLVPGSLLPAVTDPTTSPTTALAQLSAQRVFLLQRQQQQQLLSLATEQELGSALRERALLAALQQKILQQQQQQILGQQSSSIGEFLRRKNYG